ncbi:succinate dehydrogenase [Propionicicella superfundia]|uniref:succinate dehydrogenase cytochrome b subunit n=1 Tax=Propionicicella superfundia TaxID=348582 RepID=UPI000428B553
MAVTGLILVGFLLMHMYGNLKMFMGEEAFNHYAEWLKGDILYPLVPSGWFIWIFRVFLLAAVVLHMWSAIYLWHRSAKARGSKYQHVTRKVQTYSARTMRWGGIILALFIIFHILQFTTKTVPLGYDLEQTQHSPYLMFLGAFSSPLVWVIYAVCMIAVCMHVRHGFWSAFTTLGANLSKKAERVLNGLAYFVAILLYVGFMLPPTFVFLHLAPFGG